MRDLYTAMKNETVSLKFVSMEFRLRTVRQVQALLNLSQALGRMYDGGCNVGCALYLLDLEMDGKWKKLILKGVEHINVAQDMSRRRILWTW
jgi:hypothetical protein